MAQIQTPTFTSYSDFKASPYYKRAMAGEGVEYLFYDMTPGNADPDSVVAPITRGSGVSIQSPTDVYPVDEWGKDFIEEFVDGKKTISGTISTFFIPEQEDILPSTQDFKGRRFLMLMRVAPRYAGEGIALKAWDNVVLNSKDLNSQKGLITVSVRFMASREYKGEELENLGF